MRRYHTKRAINESFCKLIAVKPLDKITVRDIVEDCGLTRNTFYYYYDDIYGILEEIMDHNVDKFMKLEFGDESDPLEMLLAAIDLLPEDTKVVRNIFSSGKGLDIKLCFNKSADRFLSCYIKLIAGNVGMNKTDKKLIYSFCENAAMGIVYDWVESGMKTSLKDDLKRTAVLFSSSLVDAVNQAVSRKTK